jgi:ligand-binding sensor domain-containing protein/signal transduction histidine kinase
MSKSYPKVLLIFSVLTILNFIFKIYSQPVYLSFKHMTPDDGLSSSVVTSILQDHKGFMWIGTYNGLNRYDGHNFIIYKNVSSDLSSLAHNRVWFIFEDHQNNLLVGTSGGLCLYDWGTDQFVNYMSVSASPLLGMASAVICIEEDSIGNLWLATDNGLIYFDRINNSAVQYTTEPDKPESLSNNNIEHVLIDSRGKLWISTWNGLNMFQAETQTFRRFLYNPGAGNALQNFSFLDIVEDKKGNLWFATYGEGLYSLNLNEMPDARFKHYRHNPKNSQSLSGDRILYLYSDDQDNLWIGTENHGLNLFEREKEIFHHFHSNAFDPNSLYNESINSIYKDNSGNMWIGTWAGGINFSRKNADAILYYSHIAGLPSSLSHNSVTSFQVDHLDRIWIGTDGGGLNLFNIQTGEFVSFNSSNSNLVSDAILSIVEDSENQIWLGTWAGGLSRFDPDNKSFKSYTKMNSGIQDDNIFCVYNSKDGHLWLGSFQNGLIHYDKINNTFEKYSAENSNLSSNTVTDIKRYSDSRLLIGTNDGFNIFNTDNRQFLTYMHDPGDTNSLSNNNINTILTENDSVVWIGTQYGLSRFNPKDESFICYYDKDGLADNDIKGLAFHEAGNLWISTNKGISRFDFKQGKVKNLTKEDGLQSTEFNRNSALSIKNNIILMGGIKGFNVIYPEKIMENKNPPDVVFTDFRIFNKHVGIGVSGSPLKRHISETEELILSYDQSVITFGFAAMDFTIPGKNQYAYKMEGFEEEWNYVGNKREGTYTNLNPGKYTFIVKASNNDGIWNEEGTSVKIIILPPWWKTWLFRITAILLIITSAVVFYFYRINRLKKQKIYLEKVVKERTWEIEEKNKILVNQTNELNETNALLEERQQQIEEQAEELRVRKEELETAILNLNEINALLEERSNQIEEQAEILQAQKKELEEANLHLNELNSTKDKFFSIIAHDLKNPFNTVLGFSELLKIKYNTLSEAKKIKYTEIIYDSSKNIYSLLENLLQWARTQTNKIEFEPTNFKLKDLVEQNIILLKENLTNKKITLRQKITNSCNVYADRNMINAVLRNLLTNAIKFTNIEGDIVISSTEKDGYIEVSIKDTGIGMSKGEISQLFRVDANFSRSGTDGETGTGLGLILCKEFIVKNGGNIWVESTPGKGSRFLFTLPAAK